MHIVFVTSTYPPDNGWGGIGSYVYHMSRGLVALGHRVTVVCGFGKDPRESCKDGIRALRVIDTRASAQTQSSLQVQRVLERIISSDYVDAIEFPEYEALGLDFQRAHPSFPVIVKLHGDTELCHYGSAPAWKRFAYHFYMRERALDTIARERESASRAHVVISPSNWLLADCLRRHWPIRERVLVVPNPFSGWPSPPTPRMAHRDPCHVLWLARLERLKGANLLPDIAQAVWKHVPGTEFHLIGQQQERQGRSWIDWISDHVPDKERGKIVYIGGLPYHEIAQRCSQYSLAVFAST